METMSPTKTKGKKHKDAGIKRRVSQSVYSKDILSDTNIMVCSYIGRGFWLQSLLHIWENDTDRVEGTVDALARLWGAPKRRTIAGIRELIEHKPCEILIDGKPVSRSVTECHDLNGHVVTLINRRKQRALKARKQATLRQRRHRGEGVSRSCHGHVTEQNPTSSISSSSSPSSSKKNGGTLPPSLNELEKQKKTIEEEIAFCRASSREATQAKVPGLKKRLADVTDQIIHYGKKKP